MTRFAKLAAVCNAFRQHRPAASARAAAAGEGFLHTIAQPALVDQPVVVRQLLAGANRAPRMNEHAAVVVLDGFTGASLTDQLRRFREDLVLADLEIVGNRIQKVESQMLMVADASAFRTATPVSPEHHHGQSFISVKTIPHKKIHRQASLIIIF